jgi:hypothetical protein
MLLLLLLLLLLLMMMMMLLLLMLLLLLLLLLMMMMLLLFLLLLLLPLTLLVIVMVETLGRGRSKSLLQINLRRTQSMWLVVGLKRAQPRRILHPRDATWFPYSPSIPSRLFPTLIVVLPASQYPTTSSVVWRGSGSNRRRRFRKAKPYSKLLLHLGLVHSPVAHGILRGASTLFYSEKTRRHFSSLPGRENNNKDEANHREEGK